MIAFAPDQRITLDFRRYRRRFRSPLRTAHGEWVTRDGVLVRLEGSSGCVGFGEAAPVPGFSRETAEGIAECLLGATRDGFSMARIGGIAGGLPSLAWALECATAQLVRTECRVPQAIGIAGLLPAGEAASEALARERDSGKTTFKWKVGVGAFSEEIAVAERLIDLLPEDGKLRLDANGGLGKGFPDWLDWCAAHRECIDYLEQPLCPGCEVNMMEHASLAGVEQLVVLAERFPDAILIVKPSLLGSRWRFLQWRQGHPQRRVIYSSCFETVIGLQAAWELAVNDPRPEPAGLGTAGFLEDDGLCPIPAGAALGLLDFPKGVEAQVWRRL